MTDSARLLDWLKLYAVGREKAVTAEKIARCLSGYGKWTARKVGLVTHELREAGEIILAAYDEKPYGYFIAGNAAEALEWANKEESRAVKTLQIVRCVRASVKDDGRKQLSLV